MNFDINSIVYFYIFICISLLVFNVLYILFSRRRAERADRRTDFWKKSIEKSVESGETPREKELARLSRRLKRVNELTAYFNALELCGSSEPVSRYIHACYGIFPELADYYRRRPAMERAFFAYVLSKYPPDPGKEGNLPVMLLDFLDNSTVYCRENVLQALYAFGAGSCIEQALRIFNDNGWYHHNRMLADGLSEFRGDRAALAKSLWRACRDWDETFQIAIVQFASNVTDDMSEPFLKALCSRGVGLETRFAIIRYFTRHITPEARQVLLDIVDKNWDIGETAIAACTALSRYPGDDTEQALQKALLSRNWYVRRNAATALIDLGCEDSAYDAARRAQDRYALEMLDYVTGRNVIKKEAAAV